jgi:hypothetical protein
LIVISRKFLLERILKLRKELWAQGFGGPLRYYGL